MGRRRSSHQADSSMVVEFVRDPDLALAGRADVRTVKQAKDLNHSSAVNGP